MMADQTPLEVRGVELTLAESSPPYATSLGLAPPDPAGVRGLRFTAADLESGLLKAEALVDDVVVAVRELSSYCRYADFNACPASDSGELAFDPRALPPGAHRVGLRLTDAAGNEVVVPVAEVLQVPGAATAGASTVRHPRLVARFVGATRRKIVIPYGGRFAVRGRLTASGRGVGASRIAVYELVKGASGAETAVGEALTRSDGTFTYRSARRGPSRTLRFAYAEGAASASASLALAVRASSTLRVTLRGGVVRFRGRLRALPSSRRGKRVVLQGRAPGFGWAAFATVRTDTRGNFSGSYRLSVRRPGVRLEIRVFVPSARGYPYLAFRGRPVPVRVG
jgi:hypothetical protein